MGDLLSATEFGTPRANPMAIPTNALRIKGDAQTVYQKAYTKAVASGKKLVSVEVDGETVTFETAIYVQNVKDVEAAIAALLVDKEIGVFVRAKYDSGTLEIKYISGKRRLGVITLETAGAMTSSETSTVVSHSRVRFSYVGATALKYNGSAMTLTNSPYNYTGVAATDETKRGQLQTDFAAALTTASATYADVVVTIDDDNECFVVSYRTLTSDVAKVTSGGEVGDVVRSWDTFDAIGANFYIFE